MKLKLYYFWNHPPYMSKGNIEVSTIDWRETQCFMSERVFLKEEEADIPDCAEPSRDEINAELVKNLKAQKSEILAETHQKIARIDDKINQLLCLEKS